MPLPPFVQNFVINELLTLLIGSQAANAIGVEIQRAITEGRLDLSEVDDVGKALEPFLLQHFPQADKEIALALAVLDAVEAYALAKGISHPGPGGSQGDPARYGTPAPSAPAPAPAPAAPAPAPAPAEHKCPPGQHWLDAPGAPGGGGCVPD